MDKDVYEVLAFSWEKYSQIKYNEGVGRPLTNFVQVD